MGIINLYVRISLKTEGVVKNSTLPQMDLTNSLNRIHQEHGDQKQNHTVLSSFCPTPGI